MAVGVLFTSPTSSVLKAENRVWDIVIFDLKKKKKERNEVSFAIFITQRAGCCLHVVGLCLDLIGSKMRVWFPIGSPLTPVAMVFLPLCWLHEA